MEQRGMWPYPKGCQQPPQAGRSKGRRSSRASGGNMAFGLDYLATRTMTESISDVFSHQVCGNWLQQLKETNITSKHVKGFVLFKNIPEKIFINWCFSHVVIVPPTKDFSIIWFYTKNVTMYFWTTANGQSRIIINLGSHPLNSIIRTS